MRQRALDEIYEFQRQHWPLCNTAKSWYLPSVSFIPLTSLAVLMEQFHLVRDWEALAEIMVDWTYLEEDGHALYELVRWINKECDEEFVRKRKESTAKGALTQAANVAKKIGQQTPGAGMYSMGPLRLLLTLWLWCI